MTTPTDEELLEAAMRATPEDLEFRWFVKDGGWTVMQFYRKYNAWVPCTGNTLSPGECGYATGPVVASPSVVTRLVERAQAAERLGAELAKFCDWLDRACELLDADVPKGAQASQGSCALTAALVYLSSMIAGEDPESSGEPTPGQYLDRCLATARVERKALAVLSDARREAP